MDSHSFLKDFASCFSCERLVMVTRPTAVARQKKKSTTEPIFDITVCYTCEQAGVAVPPATGNQWGAEALPVICLSSSVVKSSVKLVAASEMVEGAITIRETDGRVTARHRDDILHSYHAGCKVATVNVYEHVGPTAVECAYLETGFF